MGPNALLPAPPGAAKSDLQTMHDARSELSSSRQLQHPVPCHAFYAGSAKHTA